MNLTKSATCSSVYFVGEAVVVDGEGVAGVDGDEEVEGDVAGAGVDVEGEVGPEVGVEAVCDAAADLVEASVFAFAGGGFDGAALGGEVVVFGDEVVVDVDEVAEGGMGDGAVVAFEVVVDDDFPVGGDLVGAAHAAADAVEREAGGLDLLGQVAEDVGERLGVLVGVDEDEGSPAVDLDGEEGELAGVEVGLVFGGGGGAEGAVEVVRPGVVVALEGFAVAAGGEDELGAAMAADVGEAAQCRRASSRRRTMGRSPRVVVRKSPGLGSSSVRPTYCQVRRKMRCCSRR